MEAMEPGEEAGLLLGGCLSGKDMILERLILYFASDLGMNISIFADLSDALWEMGARPGYVFCV